MRMVGMGMVERFVWIRGERCLGKGYFEDGMEGNCKYIGSVLSA